MRFMMLGAPWILGSLAATAPVAAQGAPERFCPNEPSLESSACTTLPGQVQMEVRGIDWTLDRTADAREDVTQFGNFNARIGVGPATEVQLGWTPYGIDRVRDRTTGAVERGGGVGDVRLAVRHAFAGADGQGLSFGMEPFVTLPVGGQAIGDGTWGAGAVIPLTYDVSDALTLGVTAEVDAVPDQDGHGRHGGGDVVGGASVKLTDALSVTAEAEWLTDRDPAGHSHQWLLASGVQYKYSRRRAVFVEAIGGLNRSSPDVQIYAGIAALL